MYPPKVRSVILSFDNSGVPVKPIREAVGKSATIFSANTPYWLLCASSDIIMISWSGIIGSSVFLLNFWMRVNIKLGLPFNFCIKLSPLVATNFDAFVLPSNPQFSKVSDICEFSSSLSVSTTIVGEPENFLRIFWERNTIGWIQ